MFWKSLLFISKLINADCLPVCCHFLTLRTYMSHTNTHNEVHQHTHTNQKIKSLLLSHHHSTSALVSEILMSMLQTVQKKKKKKNNKQFTYGQTVQKNNKQFIYGQTVQKNCTGAFTVLQTVQKNNNNLHMDRQCKKKLHWCIYSAPDSAKK